MRDLGLWMCLAGCGAATEPCLADLPADCDPLYEPTFDAVYTNTLEATCGFAGNSCHGVDGAQGGLVFADPDEAYALLLDPDDAEPRILAGDAACSPLVSRTDATDPADGMPPGDPLSEAERCAIRMWIDQGAQR